MEYKGNDDGWTLYTLYITWCVLTVMVELKNVAHENRGANRLTIFIQGAQ